MSKNEKHSLNVSEASRLDEGAVNGLAILLAVSVFIIIGVSGAAVWLFTQKNEAQSNLDAKVSTAVEAAKTDQIAKDNKDFAEREKQPNRQFVGPADLGGVRFDYPKTWSVYVDKDGANGFYEAYFSPLIVQPLAAKVPRALRLSITPRDYDEVVKGYESKVKNGSLRSSPVTVGGFNGLKLEGSFTNDIPQAAMIIFKVRDKTMLVSAEAPEYFSDFNNIVLNSLRYTP